jgi:hypothetical protein
VTFAESTLTATSTESVLNVARRRPMSKKKKKLKKFKKRIKVAPPGKRHKSKKDYKREKKVDYSDSFNDLLANHSIFPGFSFSAFPIDMFGIF